MSRLVNQHLYALRLVPEAAGQQAFLTFDGSLRPLLISIRYFRIPDCEFLFVQDVGIQKITCIFLTCSHSITAYQEIVNGNGTFQGRNLTVFTASQDM